MIAHRPWSFVALLPLVVLGSGCQALAPAGPLERFEFLEQHLDVPARIVLYAPDRETAERAARHAYTRIDEVANVATDTSSIGELTVLSAVAGGAAYPVSPHLYRVLERAVELARRTDGAFDPTVGPLVMLWREALEKRRLPSAEALAAARALVDVDAIRFQAQRHVTLTKKGMVLDLGAIAKGYAADAGLRALAELDVEHALVALGEDVALGAPPPGATQWLIAAEMVPGAAEDLWLEVGGLASAGHGDTWIEIDGARYSEVVDPRTGIGVRTPRIVTVAARDAATADALATAALVLDADRARELFERIGARLWVRE